MIFKLFYVLNNLFNLENYILCENNNIIVLILGHVHWNVANYHNKIHSFKRCIQNEYTVDSYVFRRQEKLQFCVQVFVTVIEHTQEVLNCDMTEAEFEKEDSTFQSLIFTFLLRWKPITSNKS